MPWEIDGRHWHTVDRVGRNGKPCRWDGRILAEIIDRIQNRDGAFQRNRLEHAARSSKSAPSKKSDGWFFHAITGEEWLLKLKFRTAKNTFSRDELVRRLDLKPLNDMPDLPLYGTEPRVKVRGLERAVAGDRAPRPRLQRYRPAGVLAVRRSGGGWLRQVFQTSRGKDRHLAALEAAWAKVAFCEAGLCSRRQD